jgi:RHS repeat-associated protein
MTSADTFSRSRRMARLLSLAFAVALASMPSAALAQSSQDTIIYYHTDAIGSVRAITDANGGLLARYDFEPFGVQCGAACGTGTPPETIQFAGTERDADTALDYFGARYYEDVSGRFTTVDPVMLLERNIADPQSWNRYVYARNNPLRYLDPNGEFWKELLGLIFGWEQKLIAPAPGEENIDFEDPAFWEDPVFVLGTIANPGARLAREAAERGGRVVIGKLADLRGLAADEDSLLRLLPDLGSPKANWKQNSSVLRSVMSQGQPVRDASVDEAGNLIRNTGFLRAERELLRNHGWTYDRTSRMWYPPKK